MKYLFHNFSFIQIFIEYFSNIDNAAVVPYVTCLRFQWGWVSAVLDVLVGYVSRLRWLLVVTIGRHY